MSAPSRVQACYRHPDRVAGIACQRCDRPICPACMQQASVGFHCPECARRGAQKVHQGAASWTSRPIATQVLIAVNLAVFVGGIVIGGSDSVTGRGSDWLVRDGGLWGPIVPDEPWRLLTSGFLHAGLLHVGMNMYVLWILGRMIEPAVGWARYAALYVASLAGGSLGVVLLDPEALTVGASGAIYGLMGAAILIARDRGIDLMRSGLVMWLGINLLLTFGIPGISIGGHLGGLVAGLVGGWIVTGGTQRLGERSGAVGVALLSVLTVGLFGVAYALMVASYG